jgi:hypothetical protein
MVMVMATMLACSLVSIPGEPQANIEATIAAGVAATRQAESFLKATIDAAVVATQQAGSASSLDTAFDNEAVVTVTPASITSVEQEVPLMDQRDITAVIANEVKGLITQDLAQLQSLYAPDAIVIDRGGTPDSPEDDRIWNGWDSIATRYEALFDLQISSLTLVDLSVTMEEGEAIGTYDGVILNNAYYADEGVYNLRERNGQWVITQVQFGLKPNYAFQPVQDDGLYILELGSQHRYEEPWGGDRGDPCRAWEEKNFDDTQPDHRGFNIELLLTNNSDEQAPDAWPVRFTTAAGKQVTACQYAYDGAGPAPDATSSVTFFTVVDKGDYVEKITLTLNDQVINFCLDGKGGWWRCELGR